MRTLSATLLSNQKSVGVDTTRQNPIWKIVLTRAGQSTKTYTNTRMIAIRGHIEEEYNQVATVLLDNSDNALTSINFEMYKGVISYGYNDPTQGDEYSACAPLYVTGQRLYSAQGVLVCQLSLVGIPNLLALDLAESELTLTDGDVRTVKTLLTAIASASLVPYSNYTNYTVNYDSEDNVIDSFKPKESFRVGINASRLSKIKELFAWTGNKMRVEADGQIYTFNPVTTGTTYDYEYRLAVSTYHTFFNKELRNRFVNPNKEVVASHPSHSPQYSSSATSATSFALFPQTHTTYLRLGSDSEASNIASAIKERYELDSEVGSVKVPMNAGQEVFDFINVTDSRQGDSRKGNVRYIRRDVEIPQRRGRLLWDMEIKFGKTILQPLSLSPLVGLTEKRATGEPAQTQVSINALIDAYNGLNADLISTIEKLNEVIGFVNTQVDDGYFRKLTVTEDLTIPFGS